MQTFLPYADFEKSVACLDNNRLGKQRLECKWILDSALGRAKRSNHPAALQWYGYEGMLAEYAMCACYEWIDRGFEDDLRKYFYDFWKTAAMEIPPWLGYEPYHAMHRAVLLDKDPEWYGQFGWTEKPAVKIPNKGRMSYPYIWPSKMEFNSKQEVVK